MRADIRARATTQPRFASRSGGRLPWLALVLGLVASLWLSAGAFAQDSSQATTRSLGVTLAFPDEGLTGSEQLCVALFGSTSPDLAQPPLLSRCIDPGASAVSFEGLKPGDYSVLLPGPGSDVDGQRYQGQLVATSIPDDAQLDAYGIDVAVGFTPEYSGSTGRVQVSVFGCPAGTNAGDDKDSWVNECQALAGGVPMTLSGTGSINDAAFRKVTGLSGNSSGRVEFTDLPAGAYELAGDLPANVEESPALFAESSIDGSLGVLSPSDKLALRPTETVAVDVFLVLDAGSATGLVGLTEPLISGAVAD